MTFIKSHAEALQRYEAIYAGCHRVDGISLPAERTHVVSDGTPIGLIREGLFRKCGIAPRFFAELRKHRPSVVHTHFGTCGPAGLTISRHLDVPLIVTFHGYDAAISPEEARRSYRGMELLKHKMRLIEGTSKFIAVSDYVKHLLLQQGYPEEKIVVHRNGIDLNVFSPSDQQTQQPIILFVGRFVEKKGATYLIDAARHLCNKDIDFELVMIGSGPLENSLKDAALKYQLPCRFLGFRPVSEVREWLDKARVVAVPSITASNGDSEGLPTILLEAQAMRTPIVATRHSGIPEGVKDGKTAELIDEKDSLGLAHKLLEFIEDEGKAREFGQQGRMFVKRHFDIETQVHGLELIYDQARNNFSSPG
jgi:glycosyltransferase involved in cell wall biosynthesis